MQVDVSGICEPPPVEPGLSQSGMLGIYAIDGSGNRNAKTTRLNDKLIEDKTEELGTAAIMAARLRE